MRKPLEERRMSSGTHSTTEEAIDGLVEFFTSLNAQFPGVPQQDVNGLGQNHPDFEAQTGPGNTNEIQELEDMGALARDLIRRIQRLRDQFRPGSLAALALPDIRVENEDEATRAALAAEHDGGDGHLPAEGTLQNPIPGPDPMEDEDEEEEEENPDERGSSTD